MPMTTDERAKRQSILDACRRMNELGINQGTSGGDTIRCAPYATYGTAELSDHAFKALEDRFACLLGHHGMIAIGPSLASALWLAVEVEALARQYHGCLQIGTPPLLSQSEIE